MKNTKYIPLLAVAALSVLNSGCADDFLTTSPITQKTDETYYLNESEADAALVGCYDALQLIEANGLNMYLVPEMQGPHCLGGSGTNDGDGYPAINDFRDNPSYTQNLFEGDWTKTYVCLNRVNTLLQKLDNIQTSDENKLAIEAEGKFIRAFCYYYLVQTFGQCVLLTEPTSANLPCSTADEIYAQIFSDLKFAAANGSEDASKERYGHANKYAAEGLLARAYLFYSGYYGKEPAGCTKDEAKAAVKDIISSGKYALQDNPYKLWPLAAQYKNVAEGGKFQDAYGDGDYAYAGEANNEFIFAIRFSCTGNYAGSTDGPSWIDDISIRGAQDKNMQKYGYQKGWGICTVSSVFANSFEAKDMRRDASIIDLKSELGDTPENSTYGSDTQQYTGYHIKKYGVIADQTDPSLYASVVANPDGDFQITNYQDHVILRYADVLLMDSELNENTDGINEVRKRAGLDKIESYSKDALFDERGHELCFEGIFYYDMLRYSSDLSYVTTLFAKYEGETVYNGKGVADVQSYETSNLIKHKGLCPIPENQITLSGGTLTQNDGWK
ncbi:MAG: RagB/SusD family nutrient uptake outer membrane protein [Bacteroidales bacterium]|nr:RagB/SusD family nutrient uptake outer membrane protein [Bacteroidales bacterium]